MISDDNADVLRSKRSGNLHLKYSVKNTSKGTDKEYVAKYNRKKELGITTKALLIRNLMQRSGDEEMMERDS